jgi:hypothetical protein
MTDDFAVFHRMCVVAFTFSLLIMGRGCIAVGTRHVLLSLSVALGFVAHPTPLLLMLPLLPNATAGHCTPTEGADGGLCI